MHRPTFDIVFTILKLNIAILLSATILFDCTKEPINHEDKSVYVSINGDTIIVNDLVISKSIYGFDINPRDIFFLNSSVGFVVGYNGDILKTVDSGKTWHELNSGTTLHLHSVFFLDENVGFASSQAMGGCLDADCDKGSVLLKTTDGGETWTKTFFPDYSRILSLKFFNTLNGVALIKTPNYPYSKNEHIALTSDGGIHWNLIYLPIRPSDDKLFYVDNIIFIAGENQKIFKSLDYGYNWETISTPIEAYHDVNHIYFYSENIGFIDGITAVYKTVDGGLNWIKTDFPFTNFGTLHFYDENEGFNIENVAVYEGGDFPTFKGSICYETKDGGESWSKSDLIESLHMGLIFFPQRDLGYSINFSEFYTIKKID
ncbi:MAG: YCF48-related protein [Bacteroidia bacterium]|nr:YCF48-related protein [Bacteroidia bacterium]